MFVSSKAFYSLVAVCNITNQYPFSQVTFTKIMWNPNICSIQVSFCMKMYFNVCIGHSDNFIIVLESKFWVLVYWSRSCSHIICYIICNFKITIFKPCKRFLYNLNGNCRCLLNITCVIGRFQAVFSIFNKKF